MAGEFGGDRPPFWSGENGGYESFGFEHQKPVFRSGNSMKEEEDNSFLYNEEANKRINESTKETNEQAEVACALLKLRPFGLKLNLTPTLLDSMAHNLNFKSKNNIRPTKSHHQSKVEEPGSSEKLKASNFSASLLRIGTWERKSRNEADLVAKCYYAKKKLVWEFLEKSLKRKIEIQWNDIIALKAHIEENQPGILEIELSSAPNFFLENNPQPRKHTIWHMTSDFTGGQASTFRRHYLVFPPGALDKQYEKLLQCDNRLYDLSLRPFPSLQDSPYFGPTHCNYTNFSFNYNNNNNNNNNRDSQFNFSPPPLVPFHYGQQYHQYNHPTPPQLSFKEIHSPISVMDFSHSDEQFNNNNNNNNVFMISRMLVAAQGMNSNINIAANNLAFNHLNHPTAMSYQNYCNNLSAAGLNQGGGPNMILSDLADHLLSDTQIENYHDEKYQMARIASLSALANLPQATEEDTEMVADGAMVLAGENDRASVPISNFSQNGMMQHQVWNDLSYSTVISDARMEDFDNVDGRF